VLRVESEWMNADFAAAAISFFLGVSGKVMEMLMVFLIEGIFWYQKGIVSLEMIVTLIYIYK
jgi:hypothetical protein